MSTDADIDTCAACGKEGGDSLKACTACKMVKYCNRDCQISHRKQHKKECKKRAAELYDEKLFKKVEPDECPICMIPLPIDGDKSTHESSRGEKVTCHSQFMSCCGKVICNGCIFAIRMSEGKDLCAFCRTPSPRSHEENINRTKKLMDKGNGEAFNMLAGYYADGFCNLPIGYQKVSDLWLKAGELGCARGYYNLGQGFRTGIGVEEADMKKAKYYYELSAMMGDAEARNNLGCSEGEAGNYEQAMKHFIIAARAGHKESLNAVKSGYTNGIITKDEYANTLRAHHGRQKEMKSDARDKAAASGIFRK